MVPLPSDFADTTHITARGLGAGIASIGGCTAFCAGLEALFGALAGFDSLACLWRLATAFVVAGVFFAIFDAGDFFIGLFLCDLISLRRPRMTIHRSGRLRK